MHNRLIKLFFLLMISVCLVSCAGQGQNKKAAANRPAAPGSGDSETSPMDLDAYMEIVDNFLVILDATGSKYLPYNGQIQLKIAKDILRRFNEKVPDRKLTGGLRRLGYEAGAFTEKTEIIYGMENYNRSEYARAIETIRWAGGKTPLSFPIDKGIEDLKDTVGNIAVVIISDGRQTPYYPDSVQAAHRMKAAYGDRICIYTCLVGNHPSGKRRLEQIAIAGGCGYAITADELVSDDAMSDWVDDIFNRRRQRMAEPPPILDSDGDGVPDDRDECPNTPLGARVDERGCWILENIQFDLNKWDIKPEYEPILNEIAEVLIRNPWVKMEVHGHTCNIWTEKYNMKLSHWRAMAVTSYLIKKGVHSEQLSVMGYGYHNPMTSNRTDEGRALNRRAEFHPIKE